MRIVLIDEHEMFRRGLEAVIKNEEDYSVTGSFSSVEEFMRTEIQADILFLDLSLEEGLSLEKIPLIRGMYKFLRIIALTMHNKPMLIKKALDAGVEGYVLKQSSTSVLIEAVCTVAQGGTYLDPALSDSLIMLIRGSGREKGDWSVGFSRLSRREQEVFGLAAEGLSSEQIARRLFISKRTAENHRFHVMKKLGLNKTGELIEFAREIGVV